MALTDMNFDLSPYNSYNRSSINDDEDLEVPFQSDTETKLETSFYPNLNGGPHITLNGGPNHLFAVHQPDLQPQPETTFTPMPPGRIAHIPALDGNNGGQFTVEREDKDEEARNYIRKKSICLSMIKCLLSFMMCVGLLCCVVASKISLVAIGRKLNYTLGAHSNVSTNFTYCGNSKENAWECETVFDMLILILVIPSVISFIRAILISAFRSSHPWPTGKALFWGFIGSFFEAGGLALFVLGVLSVVEQADVSIVLMNALFVVPVVWQMSKACVERYSAKEQWTASRKTVKKHSRRHLTSMVLSFFAIIAQVGGLVGIVYLTALNKDDMMMKFILVPSSILLLSIGMCPKVKKLQIDHDLEFVLEDTDKSAKGMSNGGLDFELETRGSMSSDSSSHDKKRKGSTKGSWRSDPDKVIIETNTARGKSTVINSFFKIILIPLCCCAVGHFMKIVDITQIGKGFSNFGSNKTLLFMFIIQVGASWLGYHIAWLACTMTLQRLAFALPLTLSTPVTVILLAVNRCDNPYFSFLPCQTNNSMWLYIALLSVLLWLGQFFATTYYAWKRQDFIMAGEPVLFWLPAYEGAFLEQNLLLNRKNEATNEYFVSYRDLVKDSSIYMCTTMYHEAAYEMEQLLNSIAGLDSARKEAGRKMEAHIFFDDGVRDRTLKKYALQLVSLLEKTVDVRGDQAKKIDTPYGMQLKWKLPGGMLFYIHLKDNYKVKNKKRWSQVMYMSYVLDFREPKNLDHSYILTTDADVRFTPDDVMALMDFMSRDPSVGAVCGRTHPMGSGPMVWYQVFDYAIGHWLLKVAEDVLGTVLCSPGCFSVYSARALKDVLPTYASHVECAMDFLIKDMGEDRWLCTLMIEHGWRLEYCAAAVDYTYCPDSFDEFFKQRRRWTPSTLANQIVLIQKSAQIRRHNDAITSGFIIYQLLLMISTVVGPANVIFVIATGLSYAYPKLDMIAMFIIVVFITGAYMFVCVFFAQDFQLKLAFGFTFFFSIVMTITIVGLMAQVADDIIKQANDFDNYHLAPSSVYLLFLMALFCTSAFLHGWEGIAVIHGLWYLLCLPSGYLFLTIYSLANITDRSWGTRDSKSAKTDAPSSPMHYVKLLYNKIKECCTNLMKRRFKQPAPEEEMLIADNMTDVTGMSEVTSTMTDAMTDIISEAGDAQSEASLDVSEFARRYRRPDGYDSNRSQNEEEDPPPLKPRLKRKSRREHDERRKNVSFAPGVRFKSFKGGMRMRGDATVTTISIDEWLHGHYKKYRENFKDYGYDDTSFVIGMKEQDLLDIGISNRGHRKKLLANIEQLPPEEMDHHVPEDVRNWLIKLGLEVYWPRFEENSYTEPNALADLKFMDRNTLRQTFQIMKEGHVKKLMMAIKHLQYPSAAQRKIRKARMQLEKCDLIQMETDNNPEYEFWRKLRLVCLLPEQAAFGSSEELKGDLIGLRNAALMMLTVANVIWMTIMLAVIGQGRKLEIMGTNFLGLGFLILYTLVLVAQFFTMIWHRIGTWIHLISRTPFKPGGSINMNWSFNDEDLPPEPTTEELLEAQKRISSRLRSMSRRRSRSTRIKDSVRGNPTGPKAKSFSFPAEAAW